jgi:hypothetical protein
LISAERDGYGIEQTTLGLRSSSPPIQKERKAQPTADMATQLDPNTTTREAFTLAFLQNPIPSDADAQWASLNQTLKDLLEKLLYHPAMEENRQQAFMTPAASKNRVYFLWDFVGRTLPNLYQVPWDASARASGPAKILWQQECIGRSMMTASLILNKPPGMLDRMMPGERNPPAFGDEIESLARKIEDICK